MSSPMRCLILADLHYSLQQWDWLNSVSADFDLVIIAGDLLDLGSAVDSEVQILVITKYLSRIQPKTQLLVCSGNHDGNSRNQANESVADWFARPRRLGIPVDGDALEINDTLFSICPWWDGPVTQKAVYDQLQRDSLRRREKWIWINHSPPNETTTSWTGKTHAGDPVLVQWIREFQPDMVVAGHVHQSPFRNGGSWIDQVGSTWIFNAGRQIGPCPTHIILDTETNTAKWFSFEGNEIVRLLPPITREELLN